MYYLILGKGYVGQRFGEYLQKRGTPHVILSRETCDYSSQDTLRGYLKENRPSFVINAAGFTGKPNVDACEFRRQECFTANAIMPARLAEVCSEMQIPFGHVSSGCIYTGSGPRMKGFSEEDAPNFSFKQNNCSYYSGTKAVGEKLLRSMPNTYIWRLRIPFDGRDNPRNYLSKMLNYDRLLNAANSVSHLGDFVASCVACFEKKVPYGIYNLTNPGYVTTHEVVHELRNLGATDKFFSFFESEKEFMRVAASTPRSNCILDTTKSELAGIALRPVRVALQEAILNLKNEINSHENHSHRSVRIHRKQLCA